VALAERCDEILRGLPRGWSLAHFELTLERGADANRAALILAPATPGRQGRTFQLHVHNGTAGLAPTPELVRRVLRRLDEEGITGWLKLVHEEAAPVPVSTAPAMATRERAAPEALATQWDELMHRLPPDWSDLYAQIDFDSSDFLDRGALLLAPVNPAHYGGPLSLRFRCARVRGYGVSSEMARRCLERLDREQITGTVRALRVLSDTHHVATQGPVWYVEGKSV
jgi:hypothetical protein